MSSPLSAAHLEDLRDGARRMVERTRAHEGDLDTLVATAESVARHATALALAVALPPTSAGQLNRLCVDQARRSAENADATVRACVSARQQCQAARRLHSIIDDGSAAPHVVVPSGTAAVLVVDDAQDVRDLVAFLLREAGFIVRTAANGLEALIAANEMRPDVIVMDLTMPVLDGLEATRLIKAAEATQQSRVIAYTANAPLPTAFAQWFVAVVPKPSPPDMVLAAVQHAVTL